MIRPTRAMSIGTGSSSLFEDEDARSAIDDPPDTPKPLFAAAALFSAWCSRMISFTMRLASATFATAPVM